MSPICFVCKSTTVPCDCRGGPKNELCIRRSQEQTPHLTAVWKCLDDIGYPNLTSGEDSDMYLEQKLMQYLITERLMYRKVGNQFTLEGDPISIDLVIGNLVNINLYEGRTKVRTVQGGVEVTLDNAVYSVLRKQR